ncbi:MAG: DUF308 domain-containing protein [Clostridia bacterium]|nr:DUF308 domain-containing protein [Clostridia bacterium]
MENFLKKTGWESIVTSIVFAIIGILFISNPEGTFKFAATVLGIIFIIFGAIKILNYFRDRGNTDFYNYDLIYGSVSVVAGIVIMVNSAALETIFRIIIGIWIIYSGIMRVSLALKLKSINSEVWMPVLIIAILMILCGLFITFYSGAIIMTVGSIILAYAIMDIIEGFIFIKKVDTAFKE